MHTWLRALFLPACRWSNLVKPAQQAFKLTMDAPTPYASLGSSQRRRRQLLASETRGAGVGTADRQLNVSAWLSQNSQAHGSYTASNASNAAAATNTLVFAADGSSNGSTLFGSGSSNINALLLAATTRWPASYSVRELQISVLVLFAAVAVATVLQVLTWLAWRLFKLNAADRPK